MKFIDMYDTMYPWPGQPFSVPVEAALQRFYDKGPEAYGQQDMGRASDPTKAIFQRRWFPEIENIPHDQKKKLAAVAAKRRREMIESELEVKLMEVSDLMGLPPGHPMVIAAVAYVYTMDREEETDQLPHSYIGEGWKD